MNFRNLPIATKLNIILAACAIGLLAGLAFQLFQARSDMYRDKAEGARQLVRQAMAVIEAHHSFVLAGQMAEPEARERAAEVISRMRHGSNDYFWIQDREARIVMHPIKPELNGKDMSDFKDPAGQRIFVEFARQATTLGGGTLRYLWPRPGGSDPLAKIAHVEWFAPWGWIVGTGAYVDDVERAFLRSALVQGGTLLAFMALAGLGLFLVVRRQICRPIQELQALMGRVEAEHDLTLRYGRQGDDEIGRAGRSFDRLMGYLRNSLETLGNGAREVAAASQELAGAAIQVRRSSEEQSESAASMSAAIEEMTVSIAHISENTENVRGLGEKCYEQEEESAQSVRRLKSELGRVESASRRVGDTLGQFVVSTRAISDLTRQVREISDQTNLLALNAAIEAARAGEQGRGFTIVADEVLKLAEDSARSATEIDTVTRTVAEHAASVEGAMAGSSASLTAARSLMEHVTTVLNDAEAAVVETRGGLNDISSALTEQSSAAETIARNVERIAEMAEENTAAAAQTSHSALRLQDLAQELKATVGQFRV